LANNSGSPAVLSTLDPAFSTRRRVFHQTPRFPPDPAFSSRPRVFHQVPRFPHPGTPYSGTPYPGTPHPGTPAPRFPPSRKPIFYAKHMQAIESIHFIQGHTLTLSAFPCGRTVGRTLINIIHIRSSIVSRIQECYGGWVSFGITPSLVQEISSFVFSYTSAFISSFNCLYQRDYNVIPAAETLPSECVKTRQILQ